MVVPDAPQNLIGDNAYDSDHLDEPLIEVLRASPDIGMGRACHLQPSPLFSGRVMVLWFDLSYSLFHPSSLYGI
jgi:hypothetical protein